MKLNVYQRRVLIAVAAIIVLMVLFPPHTFTHEEVTTNQGYGFILTPPRFLEVDHLPALVHADLLLAQVIAVGVAGLMVVFALHGEGQGKLLPGLNKACQAVRTSTQDERQGQPQPGQQTPPRTGQPTQDAAQARPQPGQQAPRRTDQQNRGPREPGSPL